MPSDALLKQGCLDSLERRKQSLYKLMAGNSEHMECMLSVTELKQKQLMYSRLSPARDYLKNFALTETDVPDLVNVTKKASRSLASALKDRVSKNQIKTGIKHNVQEM